MPLQEASPEALATILEEINESGANKLESNEAYIKEWMSCQPHLPQNCEDRLIRTFLRGCKHDLERTKKKLDVYYSVRTAMPELFSQRDPSDIEMQKSYDVFKVIPMPKPTSTGSRVTLFKLQPHDLSQFNIETILKHVMMIGDIRLLEETAIAGDIWVFDVKPAQAGHVAKLAVPLLRKALMCAQEAYPQRLKQIHIINAPTFVDKVLSIFRSFMKEKMKSRFHVHSTSTTLHKSIDLDSLPEDYGGNDLSLSAIHDQWVKKLESYKPWFDQQESMKSDESKRVNKPAKSNQEMFGFEGTFRVLSID